MGERRPLNVRVDEDVIQDFREYTEESKGQVRGEMGRLVEKALIEYMDNDRAARIEEKVDALPEEIVGALLEELPEREREESETAPTDTSSSSPGSQTEKRLQTIVNEMPDNTAITEAMLETPIENHAGSSPKTLDKYKRLLKKRGHVFDHPSDPGQYVTSAKSFALICENASEVSPAYVDKVVGEYEDILGKDWYLEALPDSFVGSNTLKLEEVGGDSTVEQYRRENGLLDGDRVGFQ